MLDEQELAIMEPGLAKNKADLRTELAERTRILHQTLLVDFLNCLDNIILPQEFIAIFKCVQQELKLQNNEFTSNDKIIIPVRQILLTCFLVPLFTKVEEAAPRDSGIFSYEPERTRKKLIKNLQAIGRFFV